VLDALSRNVKQIGALSFTGKHLVVYESRPSGTTFTFGILQKVDYDRVYDTIRVERLAPSQSVETFEGEPVQPVTKAAFTGMSLWILDPRLRASSYAVSLAPTAPPNHAVLLGFPGEDVLPPAVPHWEALVNTQSHRLVSVTEFADTGEMHITIGFEGYAEFLGGRVVLPLRMRWREIARHNTLDGLDTFESVTVTGGAER
jgi:hypothetical protein